MTSEEAEKLLSEIKRKELDIEKMTDLIDCVDEGLNEVKEIKVTLWDGDKEQEQCEILMSDQDKVDFLQGIIQSYHELINEKRKELDKIKIIRD